MPNKIANICWNEGCKETFDAALLQCPHCGFPAEDPRANCPGCRRKIDEMKFAWAPIGSDPEKAVLWQIQGRCPECRCHLFAQLVPTPYIMALQMAQAGLTGEMSPEIARTVNGAESARDFVGDHKIHEVLANLRNKRRS